LTKYLLFVNIIVGLEQKKARKEGPMKRFLLLTGPVVACKVVEFPLYYIMYPIIFNGCGLMAGYLIFTLFVYIASVAFILMCEGMQIDLLKAAEARDNANRLVQRISMKVIRHRLEKHANFFIFLLLVWQMPALYVVMAYRKDGERRFNQKENLLLLRVIMFANLYWTLVAFLETESVRGFYHAIKSMLATML